MRKRPMVHLALAFLLGILCVHHSRLLIVALFLLGADAVVLHSLKWNKIKIYLFALAITLAFACGAVRSGYANASFDKAAYYVDGQDELVFEGRLYKKEEKNEQTIYYLKRARTTDRKIDRILYYPKEDHVVVGSWIYAKGTVLKMHRAENEGGFDEKSYYRSMGIVAKLAENKEYRIDEPFFSVCEKLYRLQRQVRQVYDRYLYGEEAGLLAMMAIGSRTDVDAEAKELFSEAGLSHIFAISGLHISIVGMGLFMLLRKRRCPILLSALIGGFVVILYAQMVGASVSTVRAVGMFVILLLANTSGQAYDSLSTLAVMAVVILWLNPLAIGQASFVFSFGAVAGLVLVASPMAKIYEVCCKMRWEQTYKKEKGKQWQIRMHQRFFSALIWGAAMQMATLPLVAYYFYSVPVYVLFLNLVLLPVMGLLLGMGLTGGLVGCVLPQAGGWLLYPCHFLLYYYEWMAQMSLRLPLSRWIAGKPSLWQMAVYYIVIYFMIFRYKEWIKKTQEKHRQEMERNAAGGMRQRARFGGRKQVMQALLVCAVLLIFLRWHPRRFEVVMLSVGQGDGIFVDSGMREYYFIDGGSTSQQELGKYTLLPFLKSRGIGRIDVWFLTHMDLDHVSGFTELLESGFKVRCLMLAESIEKTEKYYEILDLCKKYNVNIKYLQPKNRLVESVGFFRMRELSWECVAPDVPSQFSGPNENSLVLHLQYRMDHGGGFADGQSEKRKNGNNTGFQSQTAVFDGIFTGDIGEDQERAILSGEFGRGLSEAGKQGRIELLKSAHHGSNGSNCREWLEALQPQMTIISAGKNNRYGHPGREAVARMDELGLEHICTIDTGQITVKWLNGEIVTEKYLVN